MRREQKFGVQYITASLYSYISRCGIVEVEQCTYMGQVMSSSKSFRTDCKSLFFWTEGPGSESPPGRLLLEADSAGWNLDFLDDGPDKPPDGKLRLLP